MLSCPYCKRETSESYNLCENCEEQIRCAKCGSTLVAGRSKCLMCATPVLKSESVVTINECLLEERQTSRSASRKVSVRFTDAAIEKAAPLLGGLVAIPRINGPHPTTRPVIAQPTLPLPDDGNTIEQVSEPLHSAPAPASDSKTRALQFFEEEGEGLVAKTPDFKGQSKKEQQQRFLVLYVWAYYHIFDRAVPSRDHLITAAKRTGLLDKNFARYFSTTAQQHLITSDGGYKVNTLGTAEALKILGELEDSAIKGCAYWEGSGKSPKPRTPLGKEDAALVDEWLDRPLEFGSFDVRSLKGVVHQAMFALWAITKGLGTVAAVKPKVAFLYLTRKFTTVSANAKQFTDALRKNPSRFNKNAQGLYYLTESAEREVKQWIEKGAVDSGGGTEGS